MKKKLITLLTISLSLIFVYQSCEPDPIEELGSIYGIVTDMATGEPVKNANVQLRPSGETSLTGNDGRYEFLDLKNGNYSITVSKTGYTDLIDDYVITIDGSKTVRRDVQIEVLPAELRIIDNNGEDIDILDFGSMHDDESRMFNIFNNSTTSLDYEIIKTAPWITSVSPMDGSLQPGITKPIVVIIDRDKLSVGNNMTTISITTNNGGKQLTVKANKAGDISTLEAIETTQNSAILRGSVNRDISYSEKGFYYGTDVNTTNKQNVSGYNIGEYSFNLINLQEQQIYYYKAYIKVNNEIIYGELMSFETNNKISTPSVTTSSVYNIKETSASCGGNVTSDGGSDVTAKGICWSITQNPTINDNKTNDGFGIGSFTSEITGLTNNTTYYVRAYATNSEGTSYGSIESFTTEDTPNPGEINGHEYVDLGLPSGLKWATCNVGANAPELPGNYYAWGEIETKDYYSSNNCSTYNVEMEDISGDPNHDAARAKWGSTWRMPKKIEVNELFNNCSQEIIEINGKKCTKLTSYINGNSIILPATGWIDGTNNSYYNNYGRYWSSTPDYYGNYDAYNFTDTGGCNTKTRAWGETIRPVSD